MEAKGSRLETLLKHGSLQQETKVEEAFGSLTLDIQLELTC